MNWKLKALTHWLLPHLPYGNQLHYWIQKRVTKRIPRSDARLLQAAGHARRHVDSFHRYLARPLERAVLFEFGAGWDLPIQLLFFASGASHQVIVDLQRLIKKELVNDSINRIGKMGLDSLERLPEKMIESNLEKELRQYYGIEYRAPCDATNTGLPSNTIDMVTSTETLQLIPVQDLFLILRECYRILKPGGLMSITVTYDDHYAFSDNNISVYNFLRYSDYEWRLYNPSSHYQNRLRHVDYTSLFARAGFQLLEQNPTYGTDGELEILSRLPIDVRFRSYSLEELAVHDSHFAFLKDTELGQDPHSAT